jgi:hypothetical protein
MSRCAGLTGAAEAVSTTLLLELLAQSQPGDPVPVLFSLAGWDPGTHPRVQDCHHDVIQRVITCSLHPGIGSAGGRQYDGSTLSV